MNLLFEKFGIETENEHIYQVAFTHSSYSTYNGLEYNYERLEFLGDSVLSLLVSKYLFEKYPHYEEGKLKYLKVDLEDSFLTENEILSITADIFESFLGAIFIDQGIDFAKEYISKTVFKYIDEEKIFFKDYKSAIKEYGDAESIEINYVVLNEYGLPHDKLFIMAIYVDEEMMGVGKGKSKKEAEQAAAKVAMEKLGVLDE